MQIQHGLPSGSDPMNMIRVSMGGGAGDWSVERKADRRKAIKVLWPAIWLQKSNRRPLPCTVGMICFMSLTLNSVDRNY